MEARFIKNNKFYQYFMQFAEISTPNKPSCNEFAHVTYRKACFICNSEFSNTYFMEFAEISALNKPSYCNGFTRQLTIIIQHLLLSRVHIFGLIINYNYNSNMSKPFIVCGISF